MHKDERQNLQTQTVKQIYEKLDNLKLKECNKNSFTKMNVVETIKEKKNLTIQVKY